MASKKYTMSPAHKEALAAGRESARAVRAYLRALEANKPRRGRKVSVETLQRRLDAAVAKADHSDETTKLLALQEAADLVTRIREALNPDTVDLLALEKAFIKHAKTYGDSKGISYRTWRTAGVSADVLAKAKIARTRG